MQFTIGALEAAHQNLALWNYSNGVNPSTQLHVYLTPLFGRHQQKLAIAGRHKQKLTPLIGRHQCKLPLLVGRNQQKLPPLVGRQINLHWDRALTVPMHLGLMALCAP